MEFDSEFPERVYARITSAVEEILGTLYQESDDASLTEARHEAVQNLEKVSQALKQELKDLERNSSWDPFTIAFYGETNAGKSTLIEALRLDLGESTKRQSQRAFRDLQQHEGLSEENLQALHEQQAQAQRDGEVAAQRLEQHDRQAAEQQAAWAAEAEVLAAALQEQARGATLWLRLRRLFREPPERAAHRQALSRQQESLEQHEQARAAILAQQAEAARKVGQTQETLQRVQANFARLDAHADGTIIGTGRSDFTLTRTHYDFEVDGQRFRLLDVPGIEGKEKLVEDSILAAVREAHAVFYVTSKAAPPQQGEPGHPGTLEKIALHLGPQSEVWTVFNKRVTNPRSLEGDSLVSSDELDSMADMDKKMRKVLGDHYQGSVVLSAQPAFLALAECLAPGSPVAKARAKLLDRMDVQEVLRRAGFDDYRELLTRELLRELPAKILRSNTNKANHALQRTIKDITVLHTDTFVPLVAKLKERRKAGLTRVTLATKSAETSMPSRVDALLDQFLSDTRAAVYHRIDEGISNDKFRMVLEAQIESGRGKLQEDIPKAMQEELARFQKTVETAIDTFRQQIAELVSQYGDQGMRGLDSHFELKINIDNGLNATSLVASLVGGVLMIWNPAGWVVLTLGIASVLVSVGKALYGLFSSDYKKAQQRKSADENLRKIKQHFKSHLDEKTGSAIEALKDQAQRIKQAIESPVHRAIQMDETLVESIETLEILSRNIDEIEAS